jgi:hypothetical protein
VPNLYLDDPGRRGSPAQGAGRWTIVRRAAVVLSELANQRKLGPRNYSDSVALTPGTSNGGHPPLWRTMSLVTRMNQCLRLCFAVRAGRKAGHSATRSKADWYTSQLMRIDLDQLLHYLYMCKNCGHGHRTGCCILGR